MHRLQTVSASPVRVSRFKPSDRFSERKRALFPSQDSDNDSDLGHISPLEFSSSPEHYNEFVSEKSQDIDFRYFSILDSNTLQLDSALSNFSTPVKRTDCKQKFSTPIKSNQNESQRAEEAKSQDKENVTDILAPNTPSPTDSPEKRDHTFIPETPVKGSPSQILKTPHDNSNTNLELPRLIRKSLLDISNIDKSNLKRKSDSPVENSSNKTLKFEHSSNKISKARTALFTENIFPAKSFYPKSESSKMDISIKSESSMTVMKLSRKPAPVYLCSRSRGKNRKKYFGQINAGVRHGIKKPKHKSAMTKTQLLKAALHIVKNSPLNDYLDKMVEEKEAEKENECGVSLEQIQKMDSILKTIDTRALQTSNTQPSHIPSIPADKTCPLPTQAVEVKTSTFGLKRPLSPQQESNKKFFKSGHSSRATITINDNIKLNMQHGEFTLVEKHLKIRKPKQVIEFDPCDFAAEDERVENSFSDILKTLEDDKSCQEMTTEPTAQPLLPGNYHSTEPTRLVDNPSEEPTNCLNILSDISSVLYHSEHTIGQADHNSEIYTSMESAEPTGSLREITQYVEPSKEPVLYHSIPPVPSNNQFCNDLSKMVQTNLHPEVHQNSLQSLEVADPSEELISDTESNNRNQPDAVMEPTEAVGTSKELVNISSRTSTTSPVDSLVKLGRDIIQGDKPIKSGSINDILLSPTSLVCDLTSGLALNSPKNQINPSVNPSVDLNKLSASKKRISFPETMVEDSSNKLFPVFYPQQNNTVKNSAKESRHVKNIRKIWKPLAEDQTLIDAGQKKFGVTQCPECKVMYSMGEPEDEVMHYNHHNSIHILRYNGWKHERVVNHFHNGKVIQINPNDSKSWWRKVKEVLEVINNELGFVDVPFDSSNKKVFFCIMNKQITGCVVAEPKQKAHKMLPSSSGVDQCTEESFPVKCGISRLWVSAPFRKRGIATCLMNALRSNFVYGHILSTSEIAFSATTEVGGRFATKYTKTEQFFIYTS